MKPDALRMLARQLRTDPNADAIEDAAAGLEAAARAAEAAGTEAHWTSDPDKAFTMTRPHVAAFLAARRRELAVEDRAGEAWTVKRRGLSAWLTEVGALAALAGDRT